MARRMRKPPKRDVTDIIEELEERYEEESAAQDDRIAELKEQYEEAIEQREGTITALSLDLQKKCADHNKLLAETHDLRRAAARQSGEKGESTKHRMLKDKLSAMRKHLQTAQGLLAQSEKQRIEVEGKLAQLKDDIENARAGLGSVACEDCVHEKMNYFRSFCVGCVQFGTQDPTNYEPKEI